MKIFVMPDYYAENHEELDKLVKDKDDIIILSSKSTLIPYSTPGYMLVSNKQVEEYYHHFDLINNLNMRQPIEVKHREDGSIEYMQKRFTIPPLDYKIDVKAIDSISIHKDEVKKDKGIL
nr:MAG TPA: hypothetical protein [Caudoviricetes sp.]